MVQISRLKVKDQRRW